MIDAAAELASNPSQGRRGVSTETKASLALACAALLWSGNFIAGRALRDDIAPTTLNLLRWSLCLLLLAPWVAAKCWRHRRVVVREWRLLLALGATGIAAFHTLVYVALTTTSAINALLLLSLAPAAILIGAFADGRRQADTRPVVRDPDFPARGAGAADPWRSIRAV